MDDDSAFFRKFTTQEVEWCRLWFEFLDMSERSNWPEWVANDFGDLSCGFDRWWPEHQRLFQKVKLLVIEEIKDDADLHFFLDSPPSPGDAGMLALGVSLYATRKELRAAFEEILAKYHPGAAGRPDFDGCGDCYSFYARPDEVMLRKILEVYRVYSEDQKKPKKERMPLWRIEEVVSETIPLIDKESKSAEYIWKTEDVDAHIIESRRRSQHTTIRKYLNYAEEILEHVAFGEFPVYTVGKAKVSTRQEAASK